MAARERVGRGRVGVFWTFCWARAERYQAMTLGRRMGPKKMTRDLILWFVWISTVADYRYNCDVTYTYVPHGIAMAAINAGCKL